MRATRLGGVRGRGAIAAALIGGALAAGDLRGARAGEIPSGPTPRPAEGRAGAQCPLYFLSLREVRGEDDYRIEGRIASAGPGLARGVEVDVHAVAESGEELERVRNRVVPSTLGAGQSASFRIELPIREWERTRADVVFGQATLDAHVARCIPADGEPTDPAGRSRSDYRRAAFQLQEELAFLEQDLAAARAERRSAIVRKRRTAYREVAAIQVRMDELRALREELTDEARGADAPLEWVELP